MPQPLDREGDFRGRITDYGLRKYDSGAVAVAVQVAIDECWNGESWDDWREFDVEAIGYINIVKKDKTLNQGAAQSLIDCANWNGSLESIVNHTWDPSPVGVSVRANEYKGQTSYRVEFINAYDSEPGGLGNVDAGIAKQLQMTHGAALRALAGNQARNSASPSGRPPAADGPTDDDIPF